MSDRLRWVAGCAIAAAKDGQLKGAGEGIPLDEKNAIVAFSTSG